jgi:hypothetical protein
MTEVLAPSVKRRLAVTRLILLRRRLEDVEKVERDRQRTWKLWHAKQLAEVRSLEKTVETFTGAL